MKKAYIYFAVPYIFWMTLINISYVYVSMYILDEFDQHKVCIYAVEIDQPLNSYRFCDGCG